MARREALRELARLADDRARGAFLERQPELASEQAVRDLCAEVARLVHDDPAGALAAARSARWLAGRLRDRRSRGRAERAIANAYYFRRRYADSLAAYKKALRQFLLAGDRLELAITRSVAILTLASLGRHRQALRWATAARRVFERRGDRLRLARLDLNVGSVLARRDRFHEAQQHYKDAHRAFLELGEIQDVGAALRNIAVCYQMMSDLPAALEAYREAAAYCRDHDLALLQLEVEYNISYLHYLNGEYGRALELFHRARELCVERGDRYHEALCDLDRAEIYLELNFDAEARTLAEHARRGFEELGMSYEAGKALMLEAGAAERQGENETALGLFDRAREIFERNDNLPWKAMSELHRGSVLLRGGRLAEARELAAAALERFEVERLPAGAALCEIVLSRIELEQGRIAAARRRAAAARRRLSRLGVPALQLQAEIVAARVEHSAGDAAAAEAAYLRAHQLLERLYGEIRAEELKVSFLEDKLTIYEGLVELAVAEKLRSEAARDAFSWIEKAKSRALVDLLSRGDAQPPSSPGNRADHDELRRLRRRLRLQNRRIEELQLSRGSAARRRLQLWRGEAREIENELLRVQRRLESASAAERSLHEPLTEEPTTVRDSLPPGAQLVEFFFARGAVYAAVLDRERLDVDALGPVQPVAELCRRLRFALSRRAVDPAFGGPSSTGLDDQLREILGRLHDALLGPLEPRLDGRHLVIVPHGFLHQLPFGALYDGRRHLIERFSISYAPSATVLALCRRRPRAEGEGSLVLGVPDERAPLIRDEARTVAGILPGASLFLDGEASSAVLAREGRSGKVLHIATHGFHRADNPMFSGIRLSDQYLSVLDFYGLELDFELAVLSGCSTGLGVVRGADELVGMTRGLLHAGARTVLVTLWDVNDESTALFMRHFYSQLLARGAPAEALREATAALRQQFPDPYHWAPFVLVGEPEPRRGTGDRGVG